MKILLTAVCFTLCFATSFAAETTSEEVPVIAIKVPSLTVHFGPSLQLGENECVSVFVLPTTIDSQEELDKLEALFANKSDIKKVTSGSKAILILHDSGEDKKSIVNNNVTEVLTLYYGIVVNSTFDSTIPLTPKVSVR